MNRALAAMAAAGCIFGPLQGWAAVRTYPIQPSQADPGVVAFDDTSYALIPDGASSTAPLVVFLTGTGGKPEGAVPLLQVVAGQGYRVLGLSYDDTPAVAQVCADDPMPDCSGMFRQMRVDGTGHANVRNPPAESIVHRLTAQLTLLARTAPQDGWGRYLAAGQPRWDRIVVSGHSQGAGMAAYIAKQHRVRRVVLFSSPWDVVAATQRPAPWLSRSARTPPERWWAEYHEKEVTANLIRNAYAALEIPPAHIQVFDRDAAPNSYHASTVRDVRYAPDWRALFGRPDDP